jgi:hypothetical protein
MYNEIIDLLETGFQLMLLDLVYGILAVEFDQVIYELNHDF